MPSVWLERRGKNWRCFWQIGGRAGARHSRNCGPNKTTAELFKSQKLQEIFSGQTNTVRPRSWSDFQAEYLAYCRAHKAPRTVEGFELPTLASFVKIAKPAGVAEVTLRMVELWKMRLLDTLSPNTVRMRIRTLRAAFGYALKMGYIRQSPAGVAMPPEVEVGRVLTNREVQMLQRILPATVARGVIFALHTGVRRGELLALDWSQVHRASGKPWEVRLEGRQTKNRTSRVILLHPAARAALGPARASGRVFERLSVDIVESWMRAASKKMGFRIRFHDLRHTWATNYMRLTGDLPGLMLQGGYNSMNAMTKYQHLSRARLEANLRLDYRYGSSSVPTERRNA